MVISLIFLHYFLYFSMNYGGIPPPNMMPPGMGHRDHDGPAEMMMNPPPNMAPQYMGNYGNMYGQSAMNQQVSLIYYLVVNLFNRSSNIIQYCFSCMHTINLALPTI